MTKPKSGRIPRGGVITRQLKEIAHDFMTNKFYDATVYFIGR